MPGLGGFCAFGVDGLRLQDTPLRFKRVLGRVRVFLGLGGLLGFGVGWFRGLGFGTSKMSGARTQQ